MGGGLVGGKKEKEKKGEEKRREEKRSSNRGPEVIALSEHPSYHSSEQRKMWNYSNSERKGAVRRSFLLLGIFCLESQCFLDVIPRDGSYWPKDSQRTPS